MDLRGIVELSRFFGRGSDFTVAGGGNTSVKDDRCIAIKASGVGLKDITEDAAAMKRWAREQCQERRASR